MKPVSLTILSLTVAALITPYTAAFAAGAPACKDVATIHANSESAKLDWLDTDSPERTKWIEAQNSATNAAIKKSANAKYLGEQIRTFLKPMTLDSFRLKSGETLTLVNLGVGKGIELRLTKPDGTTELLFSNSQILRNLNANILNFTVAPDQNQILLTFETKGSLDEFHHVVYDLKQRSITMPVLNSSNQTPIWASATTFYSQNYNPKTNEFDFVEIDLSGKIVATDSEGDVRDRNNKGAVINTKASGLQMLLADGRRISVKDASPSSVLALVGTTLFFTSSKGSSSEIRSVELNGSTPSASRLLMSEGERQISGAARVGDAIWYHSDSVDSRKIILMDLNGGELANVTMPDAVRGSVSAWDPVGRMLTMGLQSDFVDWTSVVYDVGNNHFARNDIEKIMFQSEGMTAQSKVIQVVGHDGVAIPVRLTYLQNTPMDGTAPAFIEVYGGFDLAGNFAPEFNPFNQMFIKKGGIIVHPIVRGGNEFGEGWHKAAMLHHKARTFEDVIAVADALAKRGYSSPKKIVLTGTSNGGMVVAASALKSPKSFGLVIPVSGVEDMLEKEILDRRMGEGWKEEYGDSRKLSDLKYLLTYGPVEKAVAAKETPKILIVNGRNDSRVNPAHSFKLQAALQARDGGVGESNLISLKNSGHWLTSLGYNDLIAWRANTVIWTTIYDHLGIDVTPLKTGTPKPN